MLGNQRLRLKTSEASKRVRRTGRSRRGFEPQAEAVEARTLLSAFITNGTIELGVNDEGHLNVPGGSPSLGGTTAVGLRYLPTNAEATAPGCLCEGWGVGDAGTGISGYADVDVDGVVNLTPVSFTSTASTAVSVVDIVGTGTNLRVTHDYHPSAVTPNLYEAIVTITNNGTTGVTDLRYRRVMDWDIEPTAFSEYVTIQGTAGNPAVLYDSDNGFATANPLGSRTSILSTGDFVDSGPYDHGALFDFGLGALAPGASKSLRIFYGGAGNETDALGAVAAVGATVYSLGQPSTDPTGGTPNTFIFAFADIANTVPVAKDDTSSTNQNTPVNIPTATLLTNDTDADGDPLKVTGVSSPSTNGGTVSLNDNGTPGNPSDDFVTYTPPTGFSGTDTFTYTISDGKGGVASATVTVTVVPKATASPLSQGYWKNHPEKWPVSSLTLGTVTYTQAQLLDILDTPVQGNGLVSLAHQLIAAKLNQANGAAVPPKVATAIADADTLIGSLVSPPIGSGFLAPKKTDGLTSILDSYNNGLLS